jgi:predicted dehydrogenase
VLCEKPFAMNAVEAERVIEAAEQSGRRVVEDPLGADLEIEADLEFPGGLAARVFASMAEGVRLASTLTVKGERGTLHVDNILCPSQGHSIATEIDAVPVNRCGRRDL